MPLHKIMALRAILSARSKHKHKELVKLPQDLVKILQGMIFQNLQCCG